MLSDLSISFPLLPRKIAVIVVLIDSSRLAPSPRGPALHNTLRDRSSYPFKEIKGATLYLHLKALGSLTKY